MIQRKDDVAQIAVAGNRIELAVELVAQIAAAVVLARFERCIGGGQDFGQGVQLVGRRVGRRPAGGMCLQHGFGLDNVEQGLGRGEQDLCPPPTVDPQPALPFQPNKRLAHRGRADPIPGSHLANHEILARFDSQ